MKSSFKEIAVAYIFLLCAALFQSVHAANLWVDQISSVKQGFTVIDGSGFGVQCKNCEIIADYGVLKYSLDIVHWADQRIKVRLPDINRGLKIQLQTKTDTARSQWLRTRITPSIFPPDDLLNPVHNIPRGLKVFAKKSNQNVGAKGEERYQVTAQSAQCGETSLLFHHARIVFSDRRFADAQIINTPKAGCTHCQPVVVRWYHEPTGRLDFQLHVYHREIEGICQHKVRD